MKMLKDRVLVKPTPPDEITKGGLTIPLEAQQPPARGEVIAVGPGMVDIPVDVKVGDKILHVPGAGLDIEISETRKNGTEESIKVTYKILRSLDIVMIE